MSLLRRVVDSPSKLSHWAFVFWDAALWSLFQPHLLVISYQKGKVGILPSHQLIQIPDLDPGFESLISQRWVPSFYPSGHRVGFFNSMTKKISWDYINRVIREHLCSGSSGLTSGSTKFQPDILRTYISIYIATRRERQMWPKSNKEQLKTINSPRGKPARVPIWRIVRLNKTNACRPRDWRLFAQLRLK